MEPPKAGEEHTIRRTFTDDEVEAFAELSGDTQPRHVEPDDDGRLMVHGLLTASLPTRIGGDLEVLAHTMDLEFSKPVYTGEALACRWVTESVSERDDRYDLVADVTVEDEDGDVVMQGRITGLVRKE